MPAEQAQLHVEYSKLSYMSNKLKSGERIQQFGPPNKCTFQEMIPMGHVNICLLNKLALARRISSLWVHRVFSRGGSASPQPPFPVYLGGSAPDLPGIVLRSRRRPSGPTPPNLSLAGLSGGSAPPEAGPEYTRIQVQYPGPPFVSVRSVVERLYSYKKIQVQ